MEIKLDTVSIVFNVRIDEVDDDIWLKMRHVRSEVSKFTTCVWCDYTAHDIYDAKTSERYTNFRFNIGFKYADSYSLQTLIGRCKNIIRINLKGVK